MMLSFRRISGHNSFVRCFDRNCEKREWPVSCHDMSVEGLESVLERNKDLQIVAKEIL